MRAAALDKVGCVLTQTLSGALAGAAMTVTSAKDNATSKAAMALFINESPVIMLKTPCSRA
ncbi:hypothetical protein PSP6_130182 [Paraburkholderia tropica]|nr:hypothetical protein PSP6_130182 [Paraburkholderia tropica]